MNDDTDGRMADRTFDLLKSFESGTREFLASWYGVELPASAAPGGSEPLALRQWWHWQQSTETPFCHQNHVLDQLRNHGDFTVFYVENQSVAEWGYSSAPDDPDPLVFERLNEDGAPWQPCHMPLSGFLHHIAAFEANVGAEHSIWITDPQPEQIQTLTEGITLFDSAAIEDLHLGLDASALLALHQKTLAVYASPDAAVVDNKRRVLQL